MPVCSLVGFLALNLRICPIILEIFKHVMTKLRLDAGVLAPPDNLLF